MIKVINSSSPWVDVQGGHPGTMYVNMHGNNPATGQVRYNGSTLEVYDGNMWTQISMGYATVGLTDTAVETLNWAHKKMMQEQQWEKMAKDNVTVADALEQYKNVVKLAEEQMKVVVALTEQS